MAAPAFQALRSSLTMTSDHRLSKEEQRQLMITSRMVHEHPAVLDRDFNVSQSQAAAFQKKKKKQLSRKTTAPQKKQGSRDADVKAAIPRNPMKSFDVCAGRAYFPSEAEKQRWASEVEMVSTQSPWHDLVLSNKYADMPLYVDLTPACDIDIAAELLPDAERSTTGSVSSPASSTRLASSPASSPASPPSFASSSQDGQDDLPLVELLQHPQHPPGLALPPGLLGYSEVEPQAWKPGATSTPQGFKPPPGIFRKTAEVGPEPIATPSGDEEALEVKRLLDMLKNELEQRVDTLGWSSEFKEAVESEWTKLSEATLSSGTDVVVHDLHTQTGFNGLQGEVESYHQDTGRYQIKLDTIIDGHITAKVKPENLKVVPQPEARKLAPPPGCFFKSNSSVEPVSPKSPKQILTLTDCIDM